MRTYKKRIVRFGDVPVGRKFRVLDRERDWTIAPVIWERVPETDQGVRCTAKAVYVSNSLISNFGPDTWVELVGGWTVFQNTLNSLLRRLVNAMRRHTSSYQTSLSRQIEKSDWRKMSVIHITGYRNDGRGVDGPIDLIIRTFPKPDSSIPQASTSSPGSLCLEDGQTIVRVWGADFQINKVCQELPAQAQAQEPEMGRERPAVLAPYT
jgi:hypothetical protein